MTPQSLAASAYATPSRVLKSARAIEYDLFTQITADLRQAQAGLPTAFPELAAALARNRGLWSELAADLASRGNALPEILKSQLLGLSRFVRTHTQGVLSGEGDPQILIEINLAIMRGLKT